MKPRHTTNVPQRQPRRHRQPPRRYSPGISGDPAPPFRIGTHNVNGPPAALGHEHRDRIEASLDLSGAEISFHYLQDVNGLPASITMEEYTAAATRTRERTSPGPSGLHLAEGQARYPRRQRQPPRRFSPHAEPRPKQRSETTLGATANASVDPPERGKSVPTTGNVQPRPEPAEPQPSYVRRLSLWVYDEGDEPVKGRHTRVCTNPPVVDEAGNMTFTPVNYLKKVDSDGETASTQDERYHTTFNIDWDSDDGYICGDRYNRD